MSRRRPLSELHLYATLLRATYPATTAEERRELLAATCLLMGPRGTVRASHLVRAVKIAPRTKRVLELLVEGKAEKEIAAALGMSRHTVHVHVKAIYRLFGATSRPELLATILLGRRITDP